jgi:hypothetical protein
MNTSIKSRQSSTTSHNETNLSHLPSLMVADWSYPRILRRLKFSRRIPYDLISASSSSLRGNFGGVTQKLCHPDLTLIACSFSAISDCKRNWFWKWGYSSSKAYEPDFPSIRCRNPGQPLTSSTFTGPTRPVSWFQPGLRDGEIQFTS